MRYAVAYGATQEVIAHYLPGNYVVIGEAPEGEGVLIGGKDSAGWTLDDYVLPRLASGLIFAKELIRAD